MDELSPNARALLSAASGSDDPTPEDRARVRHGVLLRVGAVGIGTAAFASRAAQAKGLLGAFGSKVGAALLVVLGGTAATYVALRPKAEPTVIAAPAARAARPVTRELPKPVQAPEPPQDTLSIEELPALEQSRPQKRVALRAQAPTETEAKEAPVAPVQRSPGPDSFDQERQLLQSADTALRDGMTGQAVSLLAEHAARFPQGMLSGEREGLRLVARCQSGGSQSAKQAAEAFVARAPKSPISRRVRAACGLER